MKWLTGVNISLAVKIIYSFDDVLKQADKEYVRSLQVKDLVSKLVFKKPTKSSRCFQLFWLIRPIWMRRMGGALFAEVRKFQVYAVPSLTGATKLVSQAPYVHTHTVLRRETIRQQVKTPVRVIPGYEQQAVWCTTTDLSLPHAWRSNNWACDPKWKGHFAPTGSATN